MKPRDKDSAIDFKSVGFSGGDTDKKLNMAKRIRLIRLACGDTATKDLLEIGCGAGTYLEVLSHFFRKVAGIEPSTEKYEQILASSKNNSFAILCNRAEQLPFDDASFDFVLLNEVIEHVENDAQAVEEVFRVLRSKGRLIIFAPNRWFPFETHGVQTKDGKTVGHHFPFLNYIPHKLLVHFGFTPWARNYFPNELARLLNRSGFKLVHSGFVAQTFENTSGRQSYLLRALSPVLRPSIDVLSKLKFFGRFFAVSSLIIGEKP